MGYSQVVLCLNDASYKRGKIWLDTRKKKITFWLANHQNRQFREADVSIPRGSQNWTGGPDKALNNLNLFGPALKGLGPDSDVSLTPRPRQNLPRTSHPSTSISTEAPLLWGFQYKYCRGYLLIKTNPVLLVCFPKVNTQPS